MATLIDSLIQPIVKKLQDMVTEDAILILGVKEQVIELRATVSQIQHFLFDANQRWTEDQAVKNWLSELKDAMYEVNDIIDFAMLEGNMLVSDHPSSFGNSASCMDSSFCFSLPKIRRRHGIAIQIRNINNVLHNISVRCPVVFTHQNMELKREVSVVGLRKTSELVEPNLVGKEILHSCRKLTELILRNKEQKIYKLGILGTAGVGKTTLAQKIFSDQRIKGAFSLQAWICVSQEYSEVALLKEVSRNLGVYYRNDETCDELQMKIATAIQNKSFFLVLDDVWHYHVWTNLMRIPLYTAAAGIVLVTTRNDEVARAIGVNHVHRVELMSPDVGWELLWRTMNIIDYIEVQHMQTMGFEIVRLCGGLPLAIKVIASVLATKEITVNEWRRVIDNSAWSTSKLPSELSGALYISYDDLPHPLKQCFLYCAIYPEDFSIKREDLVRFWIAEGFVNQSEEQLLEDIAEEYYYEMISRNLLYPDPHFADHSRCKMHDLLRNLAEYLSIGEFVSGDVQSIEPQTWSKIRRISIVKGNDFLVAPSVKEHIGVRTLINKHGALEVDNAIFKRLAKVRVLDLTGSILLSIPDCIGSLIHLRLLDLNETDISCLPESIHCLKYLQILNLQRCANLHSIPSGITQLSNLRRLGLGDTPITQVPKGISRLKFLNDLEGFPVGGSGDSTTKMQDGWSLEELDPLFQLRRLDIIKLERSALCISDSFLSNKRYLRKLIVECTDHPEEQYSHEDVINIENTIEKLNPSQNLEFLEIVAFFGRKFPTWLALLPSLRYMKLIDCKSCVHLAPLGHLPNLKYLKIEGATSVTKIGLEFVGVGVSNLRSTDILAFPKLEVLIIRDMPNWKEWTFVVAEKGTSAGKEVGDDGQSGDQKEDSAPPRMQLLPRLKLLELNCCPMLRCLPQKLTQDVISLNELHLRDGRSVEFLEDLAFHPDRLLITDCEGLEKVSNLPQTSDLRAGGCPNLKYVENLDKLQLLGLHESMQEVSSLWLPGLQQQCRQIHGEDLDVYNWT